MKVDLIGLRVVDFVNDKDEAVQGIKLFIAYPEENVYGKIVDSRFITAATFANFGISAERLIKHIGNQVDISLNPKGKLVGIELCQNPSK